jgi:hypothetical protein
VPDDLEVGMAQQVRNVALGAGVKIVAADDIAAFLEQALAEKGAQKPGPASDQNTLSKMHGHRFSL